MDVNSLRKLAGLIRGNRVAALGTLRDGAPLVTLVVYSVADDFSEFFLHASRLAHHTQDIMRDPRVSLMIAETDAHVEDPQALARVSIRGEAVAIAPAEMRHDAIKRRYLEKFPLSAQNFELADFALYRIAPESARFVAGLGKIFNLTAAHFGEAARIT